MPILAKNILNAIISTLLLEIESDNNGEDSIRTLIIVKTKEALIIMTANLLVDLPITDFEFNTLE